MADGKTRDEWEVSDYTQIKVDLQMDSSSFRRAMREMQEEIHKNRHRRIKKIDALQHELALDHILMKPPCDIPLWEPLTPEARICNLTQTPFQDAAKLALRELYEDGRLQRPEGALDESQFLPNSSNKILELLKVMDENLDKKRMVKDVCYGDVRDEFLCYLPVMMDIQDEVKFRIRTSQRQHGKNTSLENYYIPLDSPHETTAAPDTCNGIEALFPMHHGQYSPSAAAMEFANIPPVSYQASHDYISSHPEILDEFESTGLLTVAVENAVRGTNDKTQQLVYQAVVLDRCRVLGRDAISEFFQKIMSRDDETCRSLQRNAANRYRRILELGAALREGVSPSSRIGNNRYVPARRPDTERSKPECQFRTARTGRCGKRGRRILTGSPLASRPRPSWRSTEALSRKWIEWTFVDAEDEASLLVDAVSRVKL